MKENIREIVLQLAEPIVQSAGLVIWGLDIAGGGAITVRLFVDVPSDGAPCGDAADSPVPVVSATIDQCEEISRQLGMALEVEDCFPGPWVLEVSSPGLERRFYTLDQMRPYVGDMLEANLRTPLSESRKTWRGRLVEVGADSFQLDPCSIGQDGRILPEGLPVVTIPWERVRRAARIHIFNANPKPGKISRKKNGKSSG